jgi:hypothetical protein
MPRGAPEESWGDRQPGGFPHPEKGKPGGRVKETQQRVSRPTGTAGPLRGSAPSGFKGGAVETQDDTASEEKTIP